MILMPMKLLLITETRAFFFFFEGAPISSFFKTDFQELLIIARPDRCAYKSSKFPDLPFGRGPRQKTRTRSFITCLLRHERILWDATRRSDYIIIGSNLTTK